MQAGVHNFHAGKSHPGDGIHGDAAAVVGYLNRTVSVEGDGDMGGESFQGFVNAVVDDFPEAVHESA